MGSSASQAQLRSSSRARTTHATRNEVAVLRAKVQDRHLRAVGHRGVRHGGELLMLAGRFGNEVAPRALFPFRNFDICTQHHPLIHASKCRLLGKYEMVYTQYTFTYYIYIIRGKWCCYLNQDELLFAPIKVPSIIHFINYFINNTKRLTRTCLAWVSSNQISRKGDGQLTIMLCLTWKTGGARAVEVRGGLLQRRSSERGDVRVLTQSELLQPRSAARDL